MVSPVAQPELLMDFHDVVVVRETREVLKGLSFRIHAGQNVAIIGPNGSGKSTLLKVISQELHPLARNGSYARILGHERWDIFELRQHLGLVANDLLASSSRRLTSWEIVLSGFFGSTGIWPHQKITKEMEEKARAALHRVHAYHLADRYWTEVSSGEARRVLIARALVHEPQALVLDEPSNSLDIAALRDLLGAVRRLAQSGTNLVLVTHHLSEVIPEITHAILMKDGRVFRSGPKREVLRKDILSELFGIELSDSDLPESLQA
ncbi:MAG: ABC transporter ATP-binding protein [Candidatus Korobacteraceae bacterium]